MNALVDVARESFLILDADLRVLYANQMFYESFQVSAEGTEGKLLYELGNGQWDIPELKKLMEKILPQQKAVRNFEVTHTFEAIGEKTMLLNARQIDAVQLIILAVEDITLRKELEDEVAEYTRKLEVEVAERTEELSGRVKELEALNKTMVGRELKMVELKKEIGKLKKRPKNNSHRSSSGGSGNGKKSLSTGKARNGKNRKGNHKNSQKK